LVMVCSLFSLAGMPVFAGFTSKFYLFNAVASQGFLLLVGVAIVSSLISLYYYLTVARYLYIEEISDDSVIYVSFTSKLILIALFILMVLGGVYPSPLMDLIQTATDSILKIG
ncbi:MAG TPA: NADH-quinone oxidoreductase subunit N, partial [Dehalococcoidia bacterium]|nr:NADH-quinone oxidoreductase subunit N [Dehalococcoidia bacterium]